MSERIEIKFGQEWREKDKRAKGRVVRVVFLDGMSNDPGTAAVGYAMCRNVETNRATRIDFGTLRTRFVLVEAARPSAPKGGPA